MKDDTSDYFIGDRLSIDSGKLDKCLETLKDRKIKIIDLDESNNFHLDDLSFFKKFGKHINGIMIDAPIKDISYLYNYPHLETIFIYNKNRQVLDIDFSVFSNLKNCLITFNPKVKNLEKCTNLERLTLVKYPSQDLTDLRDLVKLKYLNVMQSKKINSIAGIENFKDLEIVKFRSLSEIEDISLLSTLSKLRYLQILHCRRLHKGEIHNYKHLPYFYFETQKYSS